MVSGLLAQWISLGLLLVLTRSRKSLVATMVTMSEIYRENLYAQFDLRVSAKWSKLAR